jgi:site-specific recombinase XerD
VTVREAILEFLAHQAAIGRSDSTRSNYRSRLKRFRRFCDAARVRLIRNVTIDYVREYHDSLIADGLSSNSCSIFMYTLKVFLRWCHERAFILADLAARMEIPDADRTLPPNPLTPEDMAHIIERVDPARPVGRRNRAILEVLYGCGLRARELLGLNLGDIDFVEGTVFVHGKGAKDRIVPINATALRAVAHYLELRGKRLSKKSPVFVTHWADGGRHRRISKNALQRLFRTINKTSPKHVHPHLLRHSYAVHLIQNGVDIRYLQALMGHESPDTTSRYLGLVKQDLRRAYDAAVEVILAG